jgi:hypothetical protein
VVDIWACQNLQVVPEEFLDLQGASITVNNFIIFIIFKLHTLSLSHSLSLSLYLSLSLCVCVCGNNGVSSCRGSQPIITNTTVEVVVPRALVPVIYGEDGECLKQILQVRSLHLQLMMLIVQVSC